MKKIPSLEIGFTLSHAIFEMECEKRDEKMYREYLDNYCLDTHRKELKFKLFKTANLYNIDFYVNFNDCDSKQSLMKKYLAYEKELGILIDKSLAS